jgi:hypothetical protein
VIKIGQIALAMHVSDRLIEMKLLYDDLNIPKNKHTLVLWI